MTRMSQSGRTEREDVSPMKHPVLYFDGICGLCNETVDAVMRLDKKKRFRYATLQGASARASLPSDSSDLQSFVVVDSKGAHRRSRAVVQLLWNLGSAYKFLAVLIWVIPLPLREWGYRFVAANRYRWFGKSDVCRVPTSEEKSLFLD
jgi:predicted DCC family thiol-disulfide oxidoreductase YuxK